MEGEKIQVGGITLTVLHTPGHAAGHLCFYSAEEKVIFTGDLLFAGAVGRYDFEDGDVGLLKESLRRIMELPEDTTIYSGHGPSTTVGQERNGNPFVRRWKLHCKDER